MTCVIDLASRRPAPTSLTRLSHPAGVNVPFDDPAIAKLLPPGIRKAISTGQQDADLIGLLHQAVKPGDRVLVIGAGIGIVSTLIAKQPGVAEVIAIEANVALIPYLQRVHAMNGVSWVESLNGVITESARRRVPFFARADYRASSLLPEDGPWDQVMRIPALDLGLILADEQISLVVCDLPNDAMSLLARADLHPVERILVARQENPARQPEPGPAGSALAGRGFASEASGTATLYRRAGASGARAAPCVPVASAAG